MTKKVLNSTADTFIAANRDNFVVLVPNGDTLQIQFNDGNGWEDKADASYTSPDIFELPPVGEGVEWRVSGISAGRATLIY